jgi:hypothetical protein
MFDDMTLLNLSGLSVSITREKAPVYTFGSATPRSISRGKRGIAGSFVFTLFDRSSFMQLMMDENHYYYAHRDEVNWLRNPTNVAAPLRAAQPAYDAAFTGLQTDPAAGATPNNIWLQDASTTAAAQKFPDGTETPDASGLIPGQIIDGEAVTVRRAPIYPDQIFPFDITLVAQNEYGQAAWSSVDGVEIINEGSGVSVDDITNEEQYTYIAIHRETWRPINPQGSTTDENRDATTTAFRRGEDGISANTGAGPVSAQYVPFWARGITGEVQTTP